MLMLLFVVRTTSKPAFSSASVTSWRVFSSPDEAKDSNPRVIACAASCFASGSADGVTSALRFSGALGSVCAGVCGWGGLSGVGRAYPIIAKPAIFMMIK